MQDQPVQLRGVEAGGNGVDDSDSPVVQIFNDQVVEHPDVMVFVHAGSYSVEIESDFPVVFECAAAEGDQFVRLGIKKAQEEFSGPGAE